MNMCKLPTEKSLSSQSLMFLFQGRAYNMFHFYKGVEVPERNVNKCQLDSTEKFIKPRKK